MNKKIKTIDIANLASKILAILVVCGLFILWGNSLALGVETYKRSYPFDFKTEQECKKSAERHRMNVNPEMIEKVTSTYVWTKGK